MHRPERRSQRTLPFRLSVFVVVVAAGCGGPKLYPVEGEVRFKDGAPLSGGLVIFQPKKAEGEVALTGSRGPIDEDGRFRMTTFKDGDGAFEGVNQVLIAPPPTKGDFERPGGVPEVIHPRHRKFETSGLEFTVTADRSKNFLKIEVDRPPPKHP